MRILRKKLKKEMSDDGSPYLAKNKHISEKEEMRILRKELKREKR